MKNEDFEKMLIEAKLRKKEFSKKVKMNPNSVTNWNSKNKIPEWVESWLKMYIHINFSEKNSKDESKKEINKFIVKSAINTLEKNNNMKNIMSKLLRISEKSYYRWKKQSHKELINLIEKYFNENDLIEFLETGEISKFEKNNKNNVEMNKFIVKSAINTLEKYNKTIIEWGIPLDGMWETEDRWNSDYSSNALISVKDAILEANSIEEFVNLVKKYTLLETEGKKWSLIELDEELSDIELDLMFQDKDEVIRKIERMISRKRLLIGL